MNSPQEKGKGYHLWIVPFVNPYQGCHDGVDVLRGGQHVPRDLVRDLVQLPDLVLDVKKQMINR